MVSDKKSFFFRVSTFAFGTIASVRLCSLLTYSILTSTGLFCLLLPLEGSYWLSLVGIRDLVLDDLRKELFLVEWSVTSEGAWEKASASNLLRKVK